MKRTRATEKHIRTSQAEKWQRRDRRAKWIPLAYPLVMLLLNLPFTVKELFTPGIKPSEVLLLFGLYTVLNLVVSGPLTLIYRAVSKTAKDAAKRNATFRITEDFDYYREKLSGLSPTTVSLLMDLKIEPNKDIAASILHLTLIGVLSPDGAITDPNRQGLSESDKLLLEALARGRMTRKDASQWESVALNETLQSGYIERTKPKSAKNGCLFGVLQFIALLFLIYWIGRYSPVLGWLGSMRNRMEALPPGAGENASLQLLTAEPFFMAQVVILLVVLGFLLMYWIALPMITIVRTLAASRHGTPFKRTPEGEVLTERVAGMKNFLRDFSDLSEAQKEQLILWDDFLVYAVVLEENRKIADEILHMKGLTYREFKLTQ
jgi:hypothetical protein